MDVRQQDVERIVVEVLKKMMSDQPTAAATTVVAASGCDGNRLALHSIAYEDARFPPITDQFDPLAAEFGPLKLP